ncbi:Histidine kinase-, DNA gyrase B-, and HSP90-like ATPase [Phycisphaerae bacterium RAS2]|nr:Histidine kinase-, DNA gyrase B-, and HSP90-like ATPase [Phycisphaerae bacterium RAS2]
MPDDQTRIEPTVDPAAEFLEICNDFTEPREIVREAISNAFDAKATVIRVTAHIDKSTGTDELVLVFQDNGHGLDKAALTAFFGLGISTRRIHDERGYKSSGAIGEKGHGTKIYFNSRRIQVSSIRDRRCITATMDEPKKMLRQGKLPYALYGVSDSDAENGTTVTVYGYNDNAQKGFSHEALKDYVFWFTKFGSFEKQLDITQHDNVVLHLRGLGHASPDPERLSFGHPFPTENNNLTDLKKSDKVSPLDFYVARWCFRDVQVDGKPGSTIDIVFGIEGDQAKRQYNLMIHQPWKTWREGEYNVEGRYGLWVAKDYIPIARKNEWIAERSEWTKYHAFVNSQDFRLTANRGSIENTPAADLECIQRTVARVFKDQIVPTIHYQKYREELERQQLYKNAEAEEKDFERRKKAALGQHVAKHMGVLFVAPRQEGGVFSIVMQLIALEPDLFGFKVVDYDTRFGYDLLVTKDYALDLNRAALRFVEMKYELRREFSHSFNKLAAVICWDTRLANDDKVVDLRGEVRTVRITSPKTDAALMHTKYMLVSDTSDHNVEVFVLKEFLREKLGLDFRARAKDE